MRTAALACLLAAFASAAFAQALTPAAADAAFHEARHISDVEGARHWGKALYGPILFVDPANNHVIGNQPDAKGELKAESGVWVGKLPDKMPTANTALTWNGTLWTMVQWPLPEDSTARDRLLAHEMFHRISGGIGLPIGPASNDHLDSRDGRIWTLLEWRALAKALTLSGPEENTAIADAILFRRHRQQLFLGSVKEENALEMNEGLAEYTGIIASEADAASARWRLVGRLAGPNLSASLVRGFAYTSGPAFGLLLDERKPTWRTGLTPTSDFATLLGSTLPAVPHGDAEVRAKLYGSAGILRTETERDQRANILRARYRAALVDGHTLTLPTTDTVSVSFDPNNVLTLGADVGSVYPTINASDAWGSLAVTDGALFSFPKHFIRVPGPVKADGGKLTGPGWTLDLAPGWKTSTDSQGNMTLIRP